MPGIPFKYSETFRMLRRATEQLHALMESGEFYTYGYLKRRALLRRVRKLYNRLSGPVSPAILRGAALAAGALTLAGCTPPTGPVEDAPPAAQTPSFAAVQINPLGIDGGAGYYAGAFGHLVLADTDGDGDLDLHFLHGTYLHGTYGEGGFQYSVARQLRDGSSFAAPDTTWVDAGYRSYWYTDNAKPLAFVDVDGDGDLDLIAIGEFSYYGEGSPRLVVLENTGTPTAPVFSGWTDFFPDAGLPSSVRAAVFVDIDGDGDLDLVTATSGGLYLTLNTSGSATTVSFADESTYSFPFADIIDPYFTIHGLVIVDLDKDGDLDLLVSGITYDYYSESAIPQILYFENQGTPASPNFAPPVANPFGISFPERSWWGSFSESTLSMVAADFDGDGDIDLLLGTFTTYDYYAEGLVSEFFYFENKAVP
ncbi:MAG: hypothetical protein EA382_03050 [Spirochaetaceae bacterium]|nr:MAG: hypothetical protein EA382_03050 [Spirochaetaceae bacterium]